MASKQLEMRDAEQKQSESASKNLAAGKWEPGQCWLHNIHRKVLKGRPAMRSSPQPASNKPPAAAANIPQTSVYAERDLSGLTIAAMLWILGSFGCSGKQRIA